MYKIVRKQKEGHVREKSHLTPQEAKEKQSCVVDEDYIIMPNPYN